ncbi:cation:proton antiporter [Chthonobacter rhizosphaerae]|uniref:cation:proton antiporter domain-containing protein n=1 Tax=Chthonobacter rhizosphaerae TaxID=2735553 RepID=UPI0015EF62C4|nr:cation:proton antiporter [Chthonobacter rhizosphaerae]
MHPDSLDLRELIVFLAAAGLVVPIAQRFRVSPVLGFLLIGLLIGPHGAGHFAETNPVLGLIAIEESRTIHLLAELGVVLLLFVIGLELSVQRLLAMRRLVFGFGGAQVSVTALVIGGIALLYGNDLPSSMVLGLCLALSSTAIVMQLLTEGRRLGSPAGRAAFAVLLLQDLAVVPILFLVGMFGSEATDSPVQAFLTAIVEAAGVIAVIAVAGRVLVRPLFRLVGATGSRELFMATVLLTVVGTSAVTAAAGLSMALGAFLAGLLLADTEYRHQIEVDVEPFKGLLLGVFFLSIGMGIDPGVVAADPWRALMGVVGLFVFKAAILFAIGVAFRLPVPVAAETAILLGQAGEFAFVVIALAVAGAVIPAETAQYMLVVTGLSMILTPLMARLGREIALRLQARERVAAPDGPEAVPADLKRHVVVAGYGRVGQLLGSLLDEQAVPHIGLDMDSRLVAAYRRAGAAVYVGDASRPEILEKVGISEASAFVVTMDSAAAAERIVKAVRQAQPTLPIYVRARDATHALRLVEHGATKAVPETIEASLQLGEAVLAAAGLPEETARAIVETRRSVEQARYTRD